jgi:hypothetical protein
VAPHFLIFQPEAVAFARYAGLIAEPLGLATQGNMDLRSFCYMYKQRFSHATLVIAKMNQKKSGKT